ncbi:hypothetical protein SDC9_146629 [bioreactor metagenome]|uniref:Uncharacterized protein n=1 Tax=bioreactor metagenome TaxID=1076179 RepID=A0A645EE88_9ZZZZ
MLAGGTVDALPDVLPDALSDPSGGGVELEREPLLELMESESSGGCWLSEHCDSEGLSESSTLSESSGS